MINLGRDMSAFFPDVIRIMVNDHAELKKLIFIYVLAYASENQVCCAAVFCISVHGVRVTRNHSN